ncbi:MAG: hypothetical protein JWN02_52 [Acidobacteria bacterium]|nr:hypothetical protein [Acidobacteriota bacterium]
MPEHPHYNDEAVVNVETHHEKSDINVRALFIFVVVFVVFAIVTHILLFYMFRFFVRIENGRTNDPLTQIQRPVDAAVPAAPRLQPFPNRDDRGQVITPNANTPVTDMEEMRANEERELHGYGWVDPQKGVAHIPIEEAKKLLLERGLPVVAGPATGTVAASNEAPSPAAGPGNAPRTPTAGPAEGDSNPARIGQPASVGTPATPPPAGSPANPHGGEHP